MLFKIHVIDHCELPNLDARLNTDNNLVIKFIVATSLHIILKKNSYSLTKKQLESSFSIFHNNIVSLNNNLEKLVTHYLENLDFHFNIIGNTETKITHTNQNFATKIPAYAFEHVPTPLASGGVGLFIDENLNYTVLEKESHEAFQALWI